MYFITKLLSFFYPFTRIIKSDYSGSLELTILNGKKVLNTLHTNYSYGSLQKVLNFSLHKLDLIDTHTVLVLGLGGGCVLKTLREEFHYSGNITAVDIDPVIIEIAEKEFNIVQDKNTLILCADAFDFVKIGNREFDLVIVDLFIDDKVPEKFLSQEFWKSILKKINLHGHIIFNTLCLPATNLQAIEDKFIKRGLDYKIYRYVENTNKVLIASYH